jgi:hypothetical protein
MIDIKVKRLFFDRAEVIGAMDKATRAALIKAGSFIRRRARSSMGAKVKDKTPPRPAGNPPRVRRGQLKNLLFFSYDPGARSVVIGPEKFGRGEVPRLHEFGGTVTHQRTVSVRTGGVNPINAKQKAAYVAKIKRGEIVPSGPKKVVAQKATYPKRQFMEPAFLAELPNLPKRWANSIKGG